MLWGIDIFLNSLLKIGVLQIIEKTFYNYGITTKMMFCRLKYHLEPRKNIIFVVQLVYMRAYRKKYML